MVILGIDLLLADNTYLCWVVRCGVNILQVVDVVLCWSSQAFILVEPSHVWLLKMIWKSRITYLYRFVGYGSSSQVGPAKSCECASSHYARNLGRKSNESPKVQSVCCQCSDQFRECKFENDEYRPVTWSIYFGWKQKGDLTLSFESIISLFL